MHPDNITFSKNFLDSVTKVLISDTKKRIEEEKEKKEELSKILSKESDAFSSFKLKEEAIEEGKIRDFIDKVSGNKLERVGQKVEAQPSRLRRAGRKLSRMAGGQSKVKDSARAIEYSLDKDSRNRDGKLSQAPAKQKMGDYAKSVRNMRKKLEDTEVKPLIAGRELHALANKKEDRLRRTTGKNVAKKLAQKISAGYKQRKGK